MTNTSLEDAGRCLLSVAWNIRTGVPRAGARKEEIRARLQEVCRSLGHAACARAAGAGPAPDHVPFLRLADLAYEIDTLLLLVDTALAPDPDRDHRRWAEIEGLVAGVDALVNLTAEVLGGQLAVSR
ncbi:hypothetical protein [Amycolatopsis sp. NPDC051903]|uniref:hypothetical protein n=1 Tax=Amycolatopsis sp. NPDC051903 TaxID=3363936 RepID=UPI0037BAC01A